MKLNTIPKEIACELLTYIADKENFTEVTESLGGDYSPMQIKALLREIARGFQDELKAEKKVEYDPRKCQFLSEDVKKIITYLSPKEERVLLKAFGLSEDQKK